MDSEDALTVDPEILATFWKVRCTDVSDALDSLGLMDVQVMSPSIRPLWEGPELKMVGVARTVKILPDSTPVPRMPYEEYERALGLDPENNIPLGAGLEFARRYGPDQVWVVDGQGTRAGMWGSDICLLGTMKGVKGFVTNCVARDSDELRRQKGVVFAQMRSCTHVFGRSKVGGIDVPVECGGVTVTPGDVIVGDNDGVVVVPRALAAEAAERAIKIRVWDIEARRKKFAALGLPFDETVDRQALGI